MLSGVARISYIAVDRLYVVAVRVEEVRGVVAGGVVAVTGRTVRAESAIDSYAVEGVNLVSRPRVEAQMQVLCWRHTVDDVHVGEASFTVALEQLRDAERSENCLVEPDAFGEVARMEV